MSPPEPPREYRDDELREELAAARTEVRLLTEHRDELRDRLDEATARIAALNEQVGRLTARSEELDSVIRERDELRTQLAEAHAALPGRVSDVLQSQLGQVNEAHAAELRAVSSERDDLRAQLNTLEQQGTETATVITPTALASHFADVLSTLAQQAEQPAGQHVSAAVTGIQVQAKGLLRAPEEEGDDVKIVTVDAGKVDPAQMSTISFDLKLLPRLPQAAPPQAAPPQTDQTG